MKYAYRGSIVLILALGFGLIGQAVSAKNFGAEDAPVLYRIAGTVRAFAYDVIEPRDGQHCTGCGLEMVNVENADKSVEWKCNNIRCPYHTIQ